MSDEQSIWDKIDIANKHPKVIYALIFIIISTMLLRPVGLPLEITYETRLAYDFIEALPVGSKVVLFNMVSTPSSLLTMGPVITALFEHLFRNDIFIMVLNWGMQGPMFFERMIPKWPDAASLYGESWVLMPYSAGGTAIQAAIASDTWGALPADYYGDDVATLPVMEHFKTAADWDVFICSGLETLTYFQIFQEPYGGPSELPCLFIASTMNWASFRPFLDSGQIVGMTNGLRGGAEYEILVGRPGTLTATMDAISATHLFWLGLIIFGNIIYFGKLSTRQRITVEKES